MTDPQPASAGARFDPWLWLAAAILAGLYVALVLIKPAGENWGRGWNLVAFLLYASPCAVIAGALALWRGRGKRASQKLLSRIAGTLGLAFPVICIIALRLKA